MFKREVAVELRGPELNVLNLALDESRDLRQLADRLSQQSFEEEAQSRLHGYTQRPGLANTVDEYRQIIDGENGSVVTILSSKTFNTSRQEQLEFGRAYGCEPVDRETHLQMLSALLKRTVKTQSSDPEPGAFQSWLRSVARPDPSESRALDVYREKIVKDASGGLQVTNNVIVQYNKQRADADSSNSGTAMLLMRPVEGPKQQHLEPMPFLAQDFEAAKLVSAVVATSLQDKSTARQRQGLETPSEDYAALAEQIRRHLVGSHSVSLGGYRAIIGQLVAGPLGLSSGLRDADFARYVALEAIDDIIFRQFNRRNPRKAYDVVLIETDEPQTREQQEKLGKELGLKAGSFEQGKEYFADLKKKFDNGTATYSEILAYDIFQKNDVRVDRDSIEVQYGFCTRTNDGPDNRSVMFYVSSSPSISPHYELLFDPSIQELYGEVTKSVRKALCNASPENEHLNG